MCATRAYGSTYLQMLIGEIGLQVWGEKEKKIAGFVVY